MSPNVSIRCYAVLYSELPVRYAFTAIGRTLLTVWYGKFLAEWRCCGASCWFVKGHHVIRCVCVLFVLLISASTTADEFPAPVNTQAAGEHPPSPEEMLDLFELPPGFKVTLFAGEPDVQQPIAFDFDDKGRIWVAENYTYSARGKVDQVMRDRVIILHDKDGDGQHDERKVFWDKGRMLTGLTWGYGGLWILNDGTLSFIPDKDGDDVPDSEPVPMLNGWTKNAGHNVVNGLLWGPDGWLYGRHGITDTSYPGTIDTPKEERKPLNCGIWRFHPVKHTFEIVCHGTTNPWGLDYNEVGDMFMSNNVIGHLWHVIPGAHYQRMFGQDFNPHCYELMGPISDHFHWGDSGKWSESRDGKADDLGGGHSHCGLMLYYGQNFPKEYWGKAFMCNTHGRCVNVDRIERKGSSYVAKHEPNFLKGNTPWFRGVQLAYGPAGCVYLSDWSDNGECHDHDGVHRTSGRIYRISYGEPEAQSLDLEAQSIHELFQIANFNSDRKEWHRRRASRQFVEEYAESVDAAKSYISLTGDAYWSNQSSGYNVQRQMVGRFQNLAAVDALTDGQVSRALICPDEILRSLAVEHITGDPEMLNRLHGLMDAWIHHHEESPAVLQAYASAIQRRAGNLYREGKVVGRFPSSHALLKLGRSCKGDHPLQLMTWYAFENVQSRSEFYDQIVWIEDLKIRSFAMRRLASDWERNGGEVVDQLFVLFEALHGAQSPVIRSEDPARAVLSLLLGMAKGVQGQVNLKPSWKWKSVRQNLVNLKDPKIDAVLTELSAAFGDANAVKGLLELIKDRNGDHVIRLKAIQSVAALKAPSVVPALLSLLNDRAVYVDICKALAAFDEDPRIPLELLKRWNSLRHGAKEAATDTLCSRKSYAVEFTKAIADGRVDSGVLTATQVRQLNSFGDESITAVVNKHWGVINETPEAIHATIAKWKERLNNDVLTVADLTNGAQLFKKTCANCHRLYGEGGKIGPDLTGGNRANMDYLLGNIIDPSAEVPKQYTTSVIALKSGRVITGVVVGETASVLSVQTDKELMKIAASDVDERTRTNKSLMPDGLLDPLSEEQVRDLLAFIQKRR